jgi:hypothetical protein
MLLVPNVQRAFAIVNMEAKWIIKVLFATHHHQRQRLAAPMQPWIMQKRPVVVGATHCLPKVNASHRKELSF